VRLSVVRLFHSSKLSILHAEWAWITWRQEWAQFDLQREFQSNGNERTTTVHQERRQSRNYPMESNCNPFRYGAEFAPDDIVGRKDEIVRAERAIRDGQRLFLIGPRGYGKTAILRAVQANMSREGAIVLSVNAESSPDLGKLVGEIVAGLAAQIYEGAEDVIQKAGRFFSHLEPTFGFSAVEQEMSVSIGIDLSNGKYRPMEVLADTLDSLDRLAHTLSDSRPLALIIDEFSALMARFGVIGEGQIRSVVQCHRNLGYIFAGSNVGLMMDMTTKYSRPFYHGGDNLYLRPVPTADFAAWLHKQFTESGFEVSGSEPVLRILSLATMCRTTSRCWRIAAGLRCIAETSRS